MNRVLEFIGHSFFIVLFYWAWVYFKERMIPFDNAFYAFKIIQERTVTIENGRYGSVLSQLLPLLALSRGWSLETFLKLYSISFVLLNYIFFLLITYVLKNRYAGLALLLALCLGYRYTFYYSASEVHQAVAPVILLFAIISQPFTNFTSRKKVLTLILAVLTIWFVSTIHLLFVFPVIFVLGFEWIREKSKRKDFVLIGALVFAFIWNAYKILSIPKDSYDASKMTDASTVFKILPNLMNLPSTEFFIDFFHRNYYAMGFTFLSLVLYYLYRKRILSLLFLVVSVFGFLILVLITYHQGESPVVMENYFLILGLFLSVPFAVEIIKRMPNLMAIFLVLVILPANLYKIWKSHLFYEQRMEYLERITSYGRTFDERKFVIHEQNIDWEMICTDWDLAFESLLYSSLKHPDSAVTFYTTMNPFEYQEKFQDTNLLIGVDFAPFWFTSEKLDPRYFNLPNTQYRILNSDQSLPDFEEDYFNADSINLKIEKEVFEFYKYVFVTIPVQVENKSARVLSSHKTPENAIHFTYRLYDLNGNIITKEGKRTPMEVDLIPGRPYTQGVSVKLPNQRGEFIVEIDLVTENKRRWGINRKCRIIVK